jgi:phosphoglycolate phosphatase-like HAD superfamily hydrolase
MYTVIFDVDDTLMHTHRVCYAKGILTARKLGLAPPSPAQFAACFGSLSFEQCVATWHPGLDPACYSEVYESMADQVPYEPVAGAANTVISLLERGVRVAVLTNGPGLKTWRKLAAAGVPAESLAFVRHAGNAVTLKPDPAAFTSLVTDFGVVAAQAAYVSDHPADSLGAAAAGFAFLGVCTGLWQAEDFRSADVPAERVLPDVTRVEPALDGLGWIPPLTRADADD